MNAIGRGQNLYFTKENDQGDVERFVKSPNGISLYEDIELSHNIYQRNNPSVVILTKEEPSKKEYKEEYPKMKTPELKKEFI